MIRKNILAVALLGVLGFSHAADVENLRTISYLNEPLRLQADIVGDGEIALAAPTEYLRLNHPIPNYDLSVEIVEQDGERQLIVRTTEDIESPALTLLLEGKDANNRRQLFELPILLDFKPDPVAEKMVEQAPESEIVIDGVSIDTVTVEPEGTTEAPEVSTDKVVLADVPKVEEKAKEAVEPALPPVPTKIEKKADKVAKVNPVPAVNTEAVQASKKAEASTDNVLVKRYGPVTNGETLWSIANKVRPSGMTPQKMIEIIKANNPSAFTSAGVLKANVTLVIPTATEKVQHKFITDKNDATNTGRVGFIYELPEPPVIATENNTEGPTPTTDDVTVKVVRPISDGNSQATDQDFVTLAPEITPKAGDEVLDVEPVNVTEQVQVSPGTDVTVSGTQDVAIPVDTNPTKPATETSPTTTVQPTSTATASTEIPANVTEPVKATEKAEATPAPEKPKPRKVYIMPEPEPEPTIIDLLFENIMYIGAGALVLILAILAIVMRRRKDGGPKPKKSKEKPSKLSKIPLAKNTAEESVATDDSQADAVDELTAEIEEKPKKKGFSLFGKKKEKEVKPKTEKPAKKGFSLFGKKKTVEVSEEEVKPKATITPKKKLKMDAKPVADKPTAIPKSATAETKPAVATVAEVATAPKKSTKDSEEIKSLDFNIFSSEPATPVASKVEPTQEEMVTGGLDFSLPTMDASLSPSTTKDNVEVKNKPEEYGGLDFDLSSFSTTTTASTAPTEQKEEVFDGLDFDLSSFAVPVAEEVATETQEFVSEPVVSEPEVESISEIEQVSVEELPVTEEVVDSGFGENNPLFASSQNDNGSDNNNIENEDGDLNITEAPEHISFSDLLGNAAETLASDDLDAEKPDFSGLLEENDADLASLIETSKSAEGNESVLDLSFVAESTESSDGLKFIDSIDLSDEMPLDDPIDSSVRDNVAKAEEIIDETIAEEQVISEEDIPVIITEEIQLPEEEIELPEVVEEFESEDSEEADLAEPAIFGVQEFDLPSVIESEESIASDSEATDTSPLIDLGMLDFSTDSGLPTGDGVIEDTHKSELPIDAVEEQPALIDNIDFLNLSMPEVDTPDTALALDDIFAELSASETTSNTVAQVTLVEPELIEVEPEVVVMPEVEEIVEPEIIPEPEVVEEIVEATPVIEPIAITPVATEVQDSLVDDAADFESEKVKLELAIAYMEFDPSLAQPLLEEVAQQGSAAQIEKAKELLAQL